MEHVLLSIPMSVFVILDHEVARINEINERMTNQFGLDLKDFLLKPQKTVAGEALPTKFQLVHGQDTYDVASLGDVCPAIRQIGGKGIEIKRFKGLGEMNAEQLWETTMNPATRTLLTVKLDDAGEADRLFSILMGGDVEKRRNFIRDHALEVQNLGVYRLAESRAKKVKIFRAEKSSCLQNFSGRERIRLQEQLRPQQGSTNVGDGGA